MRSFSVVLSLMMMVGSASAFSSMASSFGGNVLTTPTAVSSTNNGANNQLTMKKGKPNVPPNMRGNYRRQKEMSEMSDSMRASQEPGKDGFPVFNLFVRTKKANMWYPCGSFKGDEKSRALAQSYSDGGMMAGISKKQLDGGIAGSLAQDVEKLKDSVVRAYPQLRKSRTEFEWGYKLAFDGLDEEKSKSVEMVEPKKQGGVFDGIKNVFGG